MPPTPSPTPILIQLVDETSFLDSPAFIALLTLFGVIAGAALGFWFNWLLEGRKAAQDLAHKWDDLIREHAAKAIGAAAVLPSELDQAAEAVKKTIDEAIANVQTSRGSQTLHLGRVSSPSHVKLIDECSSIELIAPRTIRESSAHLRITANKFIRKAVADRGVPFAADADSDTATSAELELAAKALGDQIRKHFAIK